MVNGGWCTAENKRLTAVTLRSRFLSSIVQRYAHEAIVSAERLPTPKGREGNTLY